MTMKRNAKNEATGTLKAIQAGKPVKAHSPKLQAEMTADHGSPTYTAAAWIAQRMGRRGPGVQPSEPASSIRERNATTKIRAQRSIIRRG